MQSVSFRIWTRVAVSISYDDNHYTTGTSIYVNIYITYYELTTRLLAYYIYVCVCVCNTTAPKYT